MDKYLLKALAAVAAALALTACSSTPTAETKAVETKQEAPKIAPVTAKTAFWEIYKMGRPWATDLTPLSMASAEIPEFKNEDGKAAVWIAVLVSPSLHQARTFTYSIANSGNYTKGVSAGASENWSGATKAVMPFQTADFQIDSDVAYKTAAEKAADWLKTNTGKKVSMLLGYASQFPAPVWKITWGDAKLGYFVFVNASSGSLVTK